MNNLIPLFTERGEDMIDRIKDIIDREVRPQLALHDGDIEVLAMENGIVEIKFLGACSGCPSAKFTIEDLVEKALKEEVPEVQKVVQIYDVSPELWYMAKKLLSKEN